MIESQQDKMAERRLEELRLYLRQQPVMLARSGTLWGTGGTAAALGT